MSKLIIKFINLSKANKAKGKKLRNQKKKKIILANKEREGDVKPLILEEQKRDSKPVESRGKERSKMKTNERKKKRIESTATFFVDLIECHVCVCECLCINFASLLWLICWHTACTHIVRR